MVPSWSLTEGHVGSHQLAVVFRVNARGDCVQIPTLETQPSSVSCQRAGSFCLLIFLDCQTT